MVGGLGELPDVITTPAQQRALFWALMLYGDLHSDETPIESIDDAARLELRQHSRRRRFLPT
jgi:hypothetical protein